MAGSPNEADWIDRAERDVESLELLSAENKGRFAPMICFLCQQAAEKYLKACLIQNKMAFPKTHDFELLLQLGRQVAQFGIEVDEAAGRLQPYVVEGRYPGKIPVERHVDHGDERHEGYPFGLPRGPGP